jgi:Holliday junction resolvasome RuvABC DNA-binding subunit
LYEHVVGIITKHAPDLIHTRQNAVHYVIH